MNEIDWQGRRIEQVENSMKGCAWITVITGIVITIGLICSIII